MVFLFSEKLLGKRSAKLTGDPMLGAVVTGIILVYAEKVKFIAFTVPAVIRSPSGAQEGTEFR
ncbi:MULTISPECIES: hypothetical protein [unclassified Arthrobacter]|uniref:hypothetical protein n=1 Tax=unclassified Arthrobacter TaxID=235627 RepID=UPI003390B474